MFGLRIVISLLLPQPLLHVFLTDYHALSLTTMLFAVSFGCVNFVFIIIILVQT